MKAELNELVQGLASCFNLSPPREGNPEEASVNLRVQLEEDMA